MQVSAIPSANSLLDLSLCGGFRVGIFSKRGVLVVKYVTFVAVRLSTTFDSANIFSILGRSVSQVYIIPEHLFHLSF